MQFDFPAFVRERDEALLSLDKKKIDRYMKKYGVKLSNNEMVYWASVHKAILAINGATLAQKVKSKMWLKNHGFKPEF